MTALRESIQNLAGTRLPLVTLPDTPPEIDKAYRLVKQRLGEGLPMEPLTVKESEYWTDLARNTALQNAWERLTPRDIKNISLCLWYSDNPLAEDKKFLKRFFETCENRLRKSIYRALIWVYLHNYSHNRPGITLLGDMLARVVNNWDWSWADRHKDLKLFGGPRACQAIANAVVCSPKGIGEILESYGLHGTLQASGMSSAAFAEALGNYKDGAALKVTEVVLADLRRILEWASVGGKQFSYPKLKTSFIESLLMPWVNEAPDEKIINLTQGFLLDNFGDPRLGGASWKGVNENAMRVIRGWLVKRALAQFLDVVDELALDHQWTYRRAFWMAYYKMGVISDAWVAFASIGANQAKQIARRQEDNSWLSFGHLNGAGDPNHAVLILRIGNITIADFSHNGKCRIWNSKNVRAPKAYEKHYDRSDLTHSEADSEFIHSNSPGYLWQSRVASEINKVTGIRLSQKDYSI